MSEALNQIAIETDNMLLRAEQSYHVVQAALRDVKLFVTDYSFADEAEEINFFKEIKPMFLKELIFYYELFFFEASRPVGNKDVLVAYYNKVMERIRMFFERNQELYTYYRTGKTCFDELYFLSGADTPLLLPDYSLDMDPKFSTVQSFKLSKIMAFELFFDYLQAGLMGLNSLQPAADPLAAKSVVNIWTDTKATLIELAYAIVAKGSVDHGNAKINQVVGTLEKAFHIDLGNYYGVFTQNIRLRKKNRTVYLDQLREFLERWMEGLDE
jgi:hypothetical protein